MRLCPASAAAWAKLEKWRGATWSAGSPRSLKANRGPKNAVRRVAAAALKVLCPEMYAGNGGVTRSGVQVGSATVGGLPSRSAWRIAVTGRQRLKAYLQSQATIP